ncbi:translesion DNA synthesis-associated protein ImuA [Thiobacter aerophilum]|uniref:Translesion DNA synthesis-associated protein ImuA n=1 Tax=Thiobacter aerophilum TaxID=3121275 RepID=A0ABV0EEJ8_9BURK
MAASSLETLLQHPALWRGDDLARVAQPSLATGFAALDRALPGGGWPVGALTELLHEREGVGELRLLAPALARLTREGRWVAWVTPPHLPYAPALAAAGIQLSRLLVIGKTTLRDNLWAAEQALRAGSMGAVLFWPSDIDSRAARRLQLAAEAGGAAGFLYRPLRAAEQASPAALRIVLEAQGDELSLRLLKRRGAPATAAIRLRLAKSLVFPGREGRRPAASSFSPGQAWHA